MDYGNFSATIGQQEGIKIKIKFPKYSIGEKKFYLQQKELEKKQYLRGDNDTVKEYIKLILKVRM